MRRPVLLTLAALGGVVSLVGGTGLFAALTDTARTGTNSVDSAALSASADIRLAPAAASETTAGIDCGTFSEDLSSPLVTVSDVSPGYSNLGTPAFFCLKNVGSQTVTLSALADDLSQLDTACTGDENLHGDTTCGGNQVGELASVLRVNYSIVSCLDKTDGTSVNPVLIDNATTPHPLGTLAVGGTACFSTGVVYLDTTATDEAQKAQSDKVTWRFKFSAAA